MTSGYSTQLAALGRGITQWRTAALVLAAIAVLLAFAALRLSADRQTVIVPWQVVYAHRKIAVGDRPAADVPYLRMLAQADLDSLLDWQPDTVDAQIGIFLARLAPQAYAQYNLDLRAKAKRYRQGNVSEVFYAKDLTFVPPNRIRATGTLLRWAGQTRTLQTDATYTLTYRPTSSGYQIAGVEVSR